LPHQVNHPKGGDREEKAKKKAMLVLGGWAGHSGVMGLPHGDFIIQEKRGRKKAEEERSAEKGEEKWTVRGKRNAEKKERTRGERF